MGTVLTTGTTCCQGLRHQYGVLFNLAEVTMEDNGLLFWFMYFSTFAIGCVIGAAYERQKH